MTWLMAIFDKLSPDHYRPELHYMRGPGPACRTRQDSQPAGDPLAAEKRSAIDSAAIHSEGSGSSRPA